jgi:hypothetical protein
MARPVTTLPADKAPKPRDQSRTKNRAQHHTELLMGLANQRKREESRAASLDEADAYSVEEFCRKHRISVQVFYKYPDLMPDSFYVGTRRLISREAAARWRAEREAASAATA